MNIKLLIFDFDGTIMDTRKTIVIAKQETMRQMGLAIADEETCAGTIGLTAKIGFKKIFPELTDEMLDLCVRNYKKIFDDIKEKVPPTLFADMVDTLNKLKDKELFVQSPLQEMENLLENFLIR